MSRSPLTVPEHSELPPEVRQVYVEIDRKFGVFILPQLQQAGADDAVERLLQRGVELAGMAAQGEHTDLADHYRALLTEAQRELREARAHEVQRESATRQERQRTAHIDQVLAAARTRLPASRMSRLETQLSESDTEVSPDAKVALVEAAVLEWERLNQTRQAREAERLADRAHMPVRPRHTETSRSRRARRDQARIIELARTYALGQEVAVRAGGSVGAEVSAPDQ
ncbi:MAG: hypothetical protein ACYCX9_01000 [Candidatus Dormibacteria bacterium]|jgi:hypothetical protein